MMSITSPNDTMQVDVQDGVANVIFNRPNSLNALNEDLTVALNDITTQIRDDSSVRCVILSGAGDHFMAGGDVKTFHEKLEAEPDRTARRHYFENLINSFHVGLANMRAMPQPIVGKIRGAAAGAGVSLVLACDLAIASEDAFFTLAYCHLGTSPDGGSTFSLPRATGMKRAMEIALLGDRFDAATAEKWGLINKVVVADALDGEVDALAARLAVGPSRAYAHTKALLNRSLSSTLMEQLDAETQGFTDCATSDDFAEGVGAFVGKRKPEFKGS